jgi:hypothetical protein
LKENNALSDANTNNASTTSILKPKLLNKTPIESDAITDIEYIAHTSLPVFMAIFSEMLLFVETRMNLSVWTCQTADVWECCESKNVSDIFGRL